MKKSHYPKIICMVLLFFIVTALVSVIGYSDSYQLLAADNILPGRYGSNGKFMAPIEPPDPNAIKIYTAQDLDNVRNNLAGSYVLMNDIDLAGFNGGEWVPVGGGPTVNDDNHFSGIFDGQGFVRLCP